MPNENQDENVWKFTQSWRINLLLFLKFISIIILVAKQICSKILNCM